MKYEKFILKNFRGIKAVEIDLKHDNVVTLVGLNESGKTTILLGIYYFYLLTKGWKPSEQEWNQLRPKGVDFTGNIVLQAVAVLDEEDKQKIRDFWKAKGRTELLEIPDSYTLGYTAKFNLHKYQGTSETGTFEIAVASSKGKQPKNWKVLRNSDSDTWQELAGFVDETLLPEILFYEDFVFQIPEYIQFTIGATPSAKPTEGEASPLIASASQQDSKRNIEWQSVLDDVLKAVNPEFSSFQEAVVNIWRTDRDLADNLIQRAKGVLNKKITDAWKQLFHQESAKLHFKEIDLRCEQSGEAIHVSFKVVTDGGAVFSINERSKGCKWFFSFLLFTEFRKERSKNILFLLDEPASNLHSTAQIKIVDALAQLSEHAKVIYATHSHHLINLRWLRGAYVVVNEGLSADVLMGDMTAEDESAKISAAKYFSYAAHDGAQEKMSYFQPILDRLDYKPSPVEPIPSIVITEGRDDWYAINLLAKEKLDGLNLYPGEGTDNLGSIIRLYLSWGRPFLVLLDGDKAGDGAKRNYLKEIGPALEGKIFTLKDILNINGPIESLISEPDKKLLIEEGMDTETWIAVQANPNRKKYILNQSIIKISAEGKVFSPDKVTKSNFERLVVFLKGALDDTMPTPKAANA